MLFAEPIVFDIDSLAVGDVFMWNETGNLTFEVVGITRNPDAAFAGKRIEPFASVKWSDDNGKITHMNLTTIATYAKTGQILQEK